MNIADTLHDKAVSELDLSRYVSVGAAATVSETIDTMNQAGRSCAFVVEDERLAGIFTQRDVVERVLGKAGSCDRPIADLMSPDPFTMLPSQSVADGMSIMTEKWVRSVPVIDAAGRVEGNFSFYTVMRLVSELLSEKASLAEPQPAAQHGLLFVDFTGLQPMPAVTVTREDTVDAAVHHMRARSIGSLLVVDEREHVVGTLSEFDLQNRIGCLEHDLNRIRVEDVMTADPVTLSMRSPIADAVTTMAEGEISDIALVGESGRLVGMASFRAVADYFESSLLALS